MYLTFALSELKRLFNWRTKSANSLMSWKTTKRWIHSTDSLLSTQRVLQAVIWTLKWQSSTGSLSLTDSSAASTTIGSRCGTCFWKATTFSTSRKTLGIFCCRFCGRAIRSLRSMTPKRVLGKLIFRIISYLSILFLGRFSSTTMFNTARLTLLKLQWTSLEQFANSMYIQRRSSVLVYWWYNKSVYSLFWTTNLLFAAFKSCLQNS